MNVQSRFLQWKEQVKDGLLQKELSALSESQIKERFYKELSFGTGGLRGVLGVGTACLNIYTVARITRGVAAYIKRNALPYKVAISYDSRINSRNGGAGIGKRRRFGRFDERADADSLFVLPNERNGRGAWDYDHCKPQPQ